MTETMELASLHGRQVAPLAGPGRVQVDEPWDDRSDGEGRMLGEELGEK